jgi:hypothetical protein
MATDYENLTAEEIAAHFGTVTRQRIQQILKKYQTQQNEAVVAKIQQAKALLKCQKYKKKNGCTLDERRKCEAIWTFLRKRVGKVEAYKNCTVEFESLEQFREWAIRQVGFHKPGFEMDKDILVKGNRVYSPDTCVFVPTEINGLFSGCYKAVRRGNYPIGVCFNKGSGRFVAQMSDRQSSGLDKYLGSFGTVEEAFACYKTAKEAKIRRLAEKWKDEIDPRAYAALMSRTVDIGD